MDDALNALATNIAAALPGAAASVAFGDLNVTVDAANIIAALTFLRDDPACRFNCFIDITAVDYPAREKRFEVVYHLLSAALNHRVRVKAPLGDGEAIASAVELFPAANWFEREVYDLFGVLFTGHPDLRRILTDYGFDGHPLRKDFPMTGFVEVRYDDLEKRVVYEPVKLNQEYRQFDFLSPWEGAQGAYGLPNADPKGG